METSINNSIKLDVLLGRVGSDLEMHDGLWKIMQQKLSSDEFMKGVAYPTLVTICCDPMLKPSGRNFAMLLLTDAGEYYEHEELIENASKYIDFTRKLLHTSRAGNVLNFGDVTYDKVRGICDYIFSDLSVDIGEVHLNGMLEGLKLLKGDAKKIKNQRFFIEKVLHRMTHSIRENAKTNNKNLQIVEEDIRSLVQSVEERINNI